MPTFEADCWLFLRRNWLRVLVCLALLYLGITALACGCAVIEAAWRVR